MGQLASALGVAPGTATTMVKALAESGLVEYEPYTGVRLTAAGEKLAALRPSPPPADRAVPGPGDGDELDEVHDEAEQLEHAVSDRLIERIDEMLGRPEVDPHGDPIPGPGGDAQPTPDYDTLLTCPLGDAGHRPPRHRPGQRVPAVRRAPRPEAGQVVGVEERDAAADSVRLRGRRSASSRSARAPRRRCWCRRSRAVLLLLSLATSAFAQTPAATAEARGRALRDHRQLVPGRRGVQPGGRHLPEHLRRVRRERATGASTSRRNGRSLAGAPVLVHAVGARNGERSGRRRHAAELPLSGAEEGPGRPAFSPRVEPGPADGRSCRDCSARDQPGLQVNLPFSKQTGDWYWHWNAGFTWLPRAEAF